MHDQLHCPLSWLTAPAEGGVVGTDAPAFGRDGAGHPAGEYFYQLDYPDCRGATRHRRGTLTLVR